MWKPRFILLVGAGHRRAVPPGAVDWNGQERTSTTGLRRDAALLRNWSRFVESLQPVSVPKLPGRKLPEGLRVAELVSAARLGCVRAQSRQGGLP